MKTQQTNVIIPVGVKMPTGQLLTNAYVARDGKPFFATAVGKGISVFPVNRAGQVIGEGEFLPAGEFYLEVIHPDDLRKFSEG